MIHVRKADGLFLLAAGVVILFVSLLPSPRDQNPMIPATADHRADLSANDCLRCHGQGKRLPPSPRHPKRQDCFRCHSPQTV